MMAFANNAPAAPLYESNPFEIVLLAVGALLTLALLTAFIVFMIRNNRSE